MSMHQCAACQERLHSAQLSKDSGFPALDQMLQHERKQFGYQQPSLI